MSQKMWVNGKLVDNPYGMNLEDVATLERWKRVTVDCPFCLYRGRLSDFATFKKGTKKYPRKLSRATMECPECYQRMRLNTLLKTSKMDAEEFAWWFWENVFLYDMMKRVDGDKFFARVKKWRWEDRQVFWQVYRMWKDAPDRSKVLEDKEAMEEYVRQHEGEETSR